MNIEYLQKTKQPKFIKTAYVFKTTSFENKKKLPKNDLDNVKKIFRLFKNEELLNIDMNTLVKTIQIFETLGELEIILQPGRYEVTDLNTAIQQKVQSYQEINSLVVYIEADIIPKKSILTTSNPITFNSELNKVLELTNTH